MHNIFREADCYFHPALVTPVPASRCFCSARVRLIAPSPARSAQPAHFRACLAQPSYTSGIHHPDIPMKLYQGKSFLTYKILFNNNPAKLFSAGGMVVGTPLEEFLWCWW
jgi:hypothetical protein